MSRAYYSRWLPALIRLYGVTLLIAFAPAIGFGQQPSISAWDAANFRIWGYIPYWTSTSQINSFASSGLYKHVSDVYHFGGLRPDENGNISWQTSSYQTQFNTIRSQSIAHGFKLHFSMFETKDSVTFADVDADWESIIASPTNRANFVSQLKTFMLGGAGTADDVKGFNFDWERPSLATEWGNYTQLARELRAAFDDSATPSTNSWEITVCDYGSTDTRWDDTALFDAKVYDQIMIMGYHYGASSYSTFAAGKRGLTQQGAAKAFSNDQITVGVGTWGDGVSSAPTVSLTQIITANGGSLPYDMASFTGTIGSSTGTWNIESRKQVREKTQFALDNNMPGTFTWTLHYDAQNNLGLHRVMHHYAVVKRNVPDLNVDGKVDARDGYALADNIGATLTNTGMTSAAQFDAFYLNGNWEKGDREGNGFVNQADADWLVGRFTALGVNIPDRLPFKGTFDNFPSSLGITGRWKAGRNASGNLIETGNFKQELSNHLLWSSRGPGGRLHSNSFVTIRNQNSAELAAGLNSLHRTMQADITSNVDLSQNQDTYVKFLVRENTGTLSAAQLASTNRTLSLDFLNSTGASQFDLAFRGLQQQFAIDSVADATGQDVSMLGFLADTIYMVIAKISGNGSAANTMSASLFPVGATIGDFTSPSFAWMLTAQSSTSFNPIITDIQFTSRWEANYTVSNVWIGSAAQMLPAQGAGSFQPLASVPEPSAFLLACLAAILGFVARIR